MLTIAVALVVPVILVVDGLRIATNDEYVRAVYDQGGIPRDTYGFTKEQRTSLALTGLHSILPDERDGIGLLRRARLPGGSPAFNERELAHMTDVRNVLGGAYVFQLAAAAGIVLLAIACGFFLPLPKLVPRALRFGALLTLGLAVLVGVLSVTYYPAFSTPFHDLFFGSSSWRFADGDTLRRLYPDRFWMDTAIVLGVLAVLQAGVLLLLARAWERRAGAPRRAPAPAT